MTSWYAAHGMSPRQGWAMRFETLNLWRLVQYRNEIARLADAARARIHEPL